MSAGLRRRAVPSVAALAPFAMVLALEDFNEETGHARKAAIFHTDVVRQVTSERQVETLDPAQKLSCRQALLKSLQAGAKLDFEFVERQPGEWVITSVKPAAAAASAAAGPHSAH